MLETHVHVLTIPRRPLQSFMRSRSTTPLKGCRWTVSLQLILKHQSQASCVLFEKLLGLIDFRGQVRTSSSIRMIQHHESAVVFANSLFRQLPLTVCVPISACIPASRIFLQHT
jgi:hypothetical protein